MERRFIAKNTAKLRFESRNEGESPRFVGYGAVFYREGEAGTEYGLGGSIKERIQPGAFDRALAESDDVRGLFNHDPDNLLGRTANGTSF